MRNSRFQSDPRDRVKSAAATVVIHAALGAAFLTGLTLQSRPVTVDSLKIFDVEQPPPPPPANEPIPRVEDQAAPAGAKADPSPFVAPPARLPRPQPIAAAPIAGSGSSTRAGAADSGAGTGAGGAGAGSGGGGGIGTEARLLSGNRSRLPRHLLRPFATDNGYAHLLLTVSENGRVTDCSVLQGSGSAAVDRAMCQVMTGQSRWIAALDKAGRPIPVQVRYTATWSK